MNAKERWQRLLSPERSGAPSQSRGIERTAFQQDYDRIVFTSAFRRLKDKTQVFPLSQSDYVRTRLTHSLEASCVGRSLGALVGREIIARHDLENVESADFGAIVAAACLAHDIGNPPFGHAGEDAIREWFKNSGLLEQYPLTNAQRADFERYEGNAQGFRVLTRLQSPANPGLQLTNAVLATFSKYPRASWLAGDNNNHADAGKFGFFQDDAATFAEVANATGLHPAATGGESWQRHPLAWLMEVADDVCYLIVDLEDAARLGFVPSGEAEELLAALAGNHAGEEKIARMSEAKERIEYLRAKAIGNLLGIAATVFLDNEQDVLAGNFSGGLFAASSAAAVLEAVRKVADERIYVTRPALEIEIAGFEVIGGLFSLFIAAVEAGANGTASTREHMLLRLLPAQFLGSDRTPDPDPYRRFLKVADFIAGMTDSYAVNMYRKLKGIDLPER
ncbi:MAG: deoxyguanosinetriphosphate triphosphohydrolase [Betaproteobacteria bacterium]|nr:deoxyguanosinetriphosphate triphosphohydrolase [Betaproteobacteria bacterium]